MNLRFPIPKTIGRSALEVLLIIAIALSILLRITYIENREFWYDEVVSLNIAAGQLANTPNVGEQPEILSNYSTWLNLPTEASLGESAKTIVNLFKSIRSQEPHPPLFYVSQHFWLRLFGSSEAAMRSLGVVLSIGAIFSGYGLGKVVLGHRGGLLLAALIGTNPFHLFHSLNVRMYGPLVFWTTLSGYALLSLIYQQKLQTQKQEQEITSDKQAKRDQIVWKALLIISVVAGFMTFYLFAYWLATLAALILYLDRRRWWQHGWPLGAGVLLTVPWLLWGTRTQLRNADINRFAAIKDAGTAALKHIEDIVSVLGINLLVGDLGSTIPTVNIIMAGVAVIAVLSACIFSLWHQGKRHTLGIALLMGIFPLVLAAGVDIVGGKFTIAWGWGRSVIFIVPGCLLLLAVWIEQLAQKWRGIAAVGVLLIYLTIGIGDFSLRQRQDMQTIAAVVEQAPTTPTLIAMSARARGHVMRLAYYIKPEAPVALLAQAAPKLIPALSTFAPQYSRLIWLDSAKPVFSDQPATEQENQQIEQILAANFQLVTTKELPGTMPLDRFTMRVYNRRSN